MEWNQVEDTLQEQPQPTAGQPAVDPVPEIVAREIAGESEPEAAPAAVAGEIPAEDSAAEEAAREEAAATEEPAAEEAAPAGPVRMEVKVLPVINYAMQRNGAAPIQSVTIENGLDTPLENLELSISSVPGFAAPFTRHIDQIPAGKRLALSRPELVLNTDYLAGTTEKITGSLEFRLTCGGEELACCTAGTSVLAFDEWHGLGIYPELLATFVTPNHPELARIIARATEFLGQWTGDTSMDAYQSQDPNRVLSQAAAIFAAIKELGIAYVVPPASFEDSGQRIRLCDTVIYQKLGTCLDLTLLYASCLEAVGLHPVLITTPGHIFTGLWLEERMFPESVQDDGSLITKRMASGVNEMAVVETTCVTSGRDFSFDQAQAAGGQNLATQPVNYIIDIRRARMSHILPLPQRIHTENGWVVEHDTASRQDPMSAPQALDATIHVDDTVQEEEIPKKVQWERKLLDLGMRNTLINLRITKTMLPILTGSLDELENALADGSDFTVMARPSDMHMGEFSFESLVELGDAEIIRAEFQNKRLRSCFTEAELQRSVKELYRSAKSALEENGANTLYLALGMLRWFENKRSTKPRYAPIILVPIEMVRKSAAQGYVIRLRDDEPQMNITLLEKLKQDFGITVQGVDPLPADEHGIDIRRVLTILRQAIMNQPHWDIAETACLGIFSFSQFVMWNDIRNRTDDLLRNKIVRSLMDGKLAWDVQPLEIGERVEEDRVLLPMPADASQLYAIQAACQGESFVLHGPPGTGKSQTITSLIANALAQGKRVLFVAEKMAALEVVQKRLANIGIGPFCLELHSNKAKKRAVLDQLRQVTEVTRQTSPEDFAAKAQQLSALRGELDSYARQLHTVLPCGSTLSTLINEYTYFESAADITPFSRPFLKTLDRAALEAQQLVVERLAAAGREVGHPKDHPLLPVTCTQYTQNLRSNLQPAANAYIGHLNRAKELVATFTAATGQAQPQSYAQLQKLWDIAANMACWYTLPPAWAQAENPAFYFEEVIRMAQCYEDSRALSQTLLQTFTPEFLNQNANQLHREYVEAASSWFLSKMLGLNALTKKLNLFAKTPIAKEQIQGHLNNLLEYQRLMQTASGLFATYGKTLGNLYTGGNTDWQKVIHLAITAKQSALQLAELTGNDANIRGLLGKPEMKDTVLALSGSIETFAPAKTGFDTLLGITQVRCENWLEHELAVCRQVLENADVLKEWISFVAAATEARQLGLENVADSYLSGLDHEALFPAYRKAMLYGLICDAIDDSDTLNSFSGAVFNKKIQQYKRMDEQWSQLSRQEIYCRLASKVPNFTKEAAQSSELGILQRCIKSGGRGTSIRKLFDQIPNLLPRLAPCMLMSPISAAQYLDPKQEPFDIVVFDEASQLPTCKAVGVLARGKDAIVVGDPKQMPPTSFFATNTVDEENLDIEDMESILDDCLALNMPQSHLLWHYRSRHESLIAFSNSRFYENKLLTFPSVNDRESKVRLVRADGLFERGKSRRNKAEAEAIVQELKRRCHDPRLSGQSVGVVTFNINQQNLIDDLMTEACAQDPVLEKWAYGADEPLFIKNLENVQGDERDVILFSVCYGPDETGHMFMNFGPLNRDGGWRRLNVAVSRARHEMMVFVSFPSEKIDLNRTQSEGVAALKAFLEYAEGRELALDEASAQTYKNPGSGIATAISHILAEKGYETDLSVGRSEYRMDICVVDPRKPDRYLLGIMLDGRGYGSAKTTRDRELAQISVLGGLGWNILRVWTMDWWDNRQKEVNRILDTLEQLLALPLPEDQPPAPEAPAEEAAGEQPAEDAPAQESAPGEAPEATGPETPAQQDPVLAAAPPAPKAAEAPVYQASQFPATALTADEFTEPRNRRSIESRIAKVLAEESPVCNTRLMRHVVQSYGIARAGSRIQTYLYSILQTMPLKTTPQTDTYFFWREDQDPATYPLFRVNGEGTSHRDIREVPVQEVSNAICVVLYEQFSMAREDLLREIARKLGFTRVGGNVLSVLEDGLSYAQAQEAITTGSGGTLMLTDLGTQRALATLEAFRNM